MYCSPLPSGPWAERPVDLGEPPVEEGSGRDAADRDRRRRAWGRFTRNFVVQGTAAEWASCWLADLRNRLWRLGGSGPLCARPHLVFFLHITSGPDNTNNELALANGFIKYYL